MGGSSFSSGTLLNPFCVLRNIQKRFGGRIALDGISFEFLPGECCALIGRSGAGKTTLLRILALLDKPTVGSVVIDGLQFGEYEKVPLETRRKIAFLPHRPYLFRGTVFDNVAYGLRVRGVQREKAGERVKEVLTSLGIDHLRGRKTSELSAGEVQRVALARLVAPEPELLILDEPTSNLDSENAEIVTQAIMNEASPNRGTTIFVTHDLPLAKKLSTRILFLEDGRLKENRE